MTTGVARFPRNERRDPIPLRVGKTMPLHPRLPTPEASPGFAALNHQSISMGTLGANPESLCRTRFPPLITRSAENP
jgi:hypothetical protein